MVEPYIVFRGKANAAIEFYEKVFSGADKSVMHYSDMPENPDFPVPDEIKDWIVHAEMTIRGTRFSFGDTQDDVTPSTMLSLVIRYNTPEELTEAYNTLMCSGEALMELGPQFYAKLYAWVKDKFGVSWQLICE